MSNPTDTLIQAAQGLREELKRLRFGPPVTHVYNPLEYAWPAHAAYLTRFGRGRKRVLFLGLNPGPFGMAQTGVPFGEVRAVRDWLGLHAAIQRPELEHPRRPVLGFNCPRSEVSGQRLWAFFARQFGPAEKFFNRHFVLNYCPLAFFEETGRNRTPDKLPLRERQALLAACDRHLLRVCEVLRPQWVIGIGKFAATRANQVLKQHAIKVGDILHPSPASPAANRAWASTALRQLQKLGVWT